MKKIIFTLLVCSIAYSNSFAQDKVSLKAALNSVNQWYQLKDSDAAYKIEFPEKPSQENTDVPTDKGNVVMNMYTLQNDDGVNLIYMTSFTEYPSSFFPNKLQSTEKQDEVLSNSVQGAVTNTGGNLLSDKRIFFNGYKGREVKLSIEGGYIIKMKVLLVGIKLYLVQVIYNEANDNNPKQQRFFDSFELINVKQ